jgi:histidinol dehydrogenase
MNLTEKRNLRSVTERNNKNLIKVIKQVENNKKSRNNVSRNINRNSINSTKGDLGLNIYSSAFIKSKNEVVNVNDMFLKTDYNEKKKKVKNNLNAYQGFSQIKKYIQNQKKFLKK